MSDPDPERHPNALPGPEHLLAGLTAEQAQAVTHGAGPLLLIAGPGAGKTCILTHRIAYLLDTEQARADQILAVTSASGAGARARLLTREKAPTATARRSSQSRPRGDESR